MLKSGKTVLGSKKNLDYVLRFKSQKPNKKSKFNNYLLRLFLRVFFNLKIIIKMIIDCLGYFKVSVSCSNEEQDNAEKIIGRILCDRVDDDPNFDKDQIISRKNLYTQNKNYINENINMANFFIKTVFNGGYSIDVRNFYLVDNVKNIINERYLESYSPVKQQKLSRKDLSEGFFLSDVSTKKPSPKEEKRIKDELEKEFFEGIIKNIYKENKDYFDSKAEFENDVEHSEYRSLTLISNFVDYIKHKFRLFKGGKISRVNGNFISNPTISLRNLQKITLEQGAKFLNEDNIDLDSEVYFLDESILWNMALFTPELFNDEYRSQYVFGKQSCFDEMNPPRLNIVEFIKNKLEEGPLLIFTDSRDEKIKSQYENLEVIYLEDVNRGDIESLIKINGCKSFVIIVNIYNFLKLSEQYIFREKIYEDNIIVNKYINNGVLLRPCIYDEDDNNDYAITHDRKGNYSSHE